MRIAHKFTLAFAGSAALLVGVGGMMQLSSERRELRMVAENETALLADALEVAFGNALRDRQLADVSETLDALLQSESEAKVFLFGPELEVIAASSGAQASNATQAAARRAHELDPEDKQITFLDIDPVPMVRVTLSVNEPGVSRAALVVERWLPEMRRDLVETRRGILLVVVGLVLTMTVLAFALARAFIGKPLEQLAADMRRVRGGDLQASPVREQSDEVGAVQVQFNELVEELRIARQQLEDDQEALRRMQRRLQEADKLVTLGQLSAAVAHEIGSPLQILEGRALALLRRPGDPAATARTAQILVEQAGRITRIVSQMLALARRRPAERRDEDPRRAVRAVLELLELEAKRLGVRLRLDDGGCPAQAYLDIDQLQQLVLNLVRNALEASPADGLVEVVLGRGTLESADGRERESFRISVSDRGAGIPPELLPTVFEPFTSTRAEEGGTGLGLAVVKAIVDEHSGRITVESEPGRGCRFVVDLPLRAGEGPVARSEVHDG